MTGITYFCTDSHGNTYTRYSASHNRPIYTHAVIGRKAGFTGPVSKQGVLYSSRLDLAQQNARTGFSTGAETEVRQVRAYYGKLKAEPAADEYRDHCSLL